MIVEAQAPQAPSATTSTPTPATATESPAAARAALLAGITATLAACGGGGGGAEPGPLAPAGPAPAPVQLSTAGYSHAAAASDADAARFLLQAQFSASESEIAAVRASGYAGWLGQQMAQPRSISGWDWLERQGFGDASSDQAYYDASYPADRMIWYQLLTASDAVRQRCALALSEFFVVSLSGLEFRWRSHAMAAWWDLLCTHAFGNFRELLEAVTLNAAMGYYLNTRGNQREDARTGRQPDENYAREVMQLMSIGLYQLNVDGTERRDAAGNRIETYTQTDVTQLARVFTGYDLDQSQNVAGKIGNPNFARLPMAFNAARHSTLDASFLGTPIPPNTDGRVALGAAMQTLFNHPNTAPFFSRQMIQRLVTSNPSPGYVARVAAAFNNSGGVRGDLKAVWAAILLDDEARGPTGLGNPVHGKLREPMLRFVQWGRSFGLNSADGSWAIGDLSNPANRLGQSPLRAPSVFNFFRPGYVPPATALAEQQQVAPEFQIVNESSVGGYLNYLQGIVRTGLSADITVAYTTELAIAHDATALVHRLNLLLCAAQLSPATQALIVGALNATAVTATSSESVKRNRIGAAVLLVMASAEYLVQK